MVTLTRPPSATAGALVDGARTRDALEVRADLIGDLDVGWLRARFPGRLIYALRHASLGGHDRSGDERRRMRLIAAAEAGYDLVELDLRALEPALLRRIPAASRMISTHSAAGDLRTLHDCVAALVAVPAALYRVVVPADSPRTALVILELAAAVGRRDLIAHADGDAGLFTRVLAPRWGAPLVCAGDDPHVDPLELATLGAPGAALDHLFGITGARVAGSRSPILHHARLRARGISAAYVHFPAHDLDALLDAAFLGGLKRLGLPLRGLTVAAPLKERALARAAAASPRAREALAANLLRVERDGEGRVDRFVADTTDGVGVIDPLDARGVALAGATAAVIGCGGAGRAAAVELRRRGARVRLINRSEARGRVCAEGLGLPFTRLRDFSPADVAILVNATPCGDELAPIVEGMAPGAVLVDFVYGAAASLARRASARGLAAVTGEDVLVAEVAAQFELMNQARGPRG